MQHRFASLPCEIRLQIWDYALSASRLVSVDFSLSFAPTKQDNYKARTDSCCPEQLPPTISSCVSSTPAPSILHTCVQSRQRALKVYRPLFTPGGAPKTIYFNPEADTAYFRPRGSNSAAIDVQLCAFLPLCNSSELAAIKHIALDAKFSPGNTITSMVTLFSRICEYMPRLLEITLIVEEEPGGAAARNMVEMRLHQQTYQALRILSRDLPRWSTPAWAPPGVSIVPSENIEHTWC